MIRGHALESVVAAGLAPSVKWLQKELRARRIPGRKIGRHWVMTDNDLDTYLTTAANTTSDVAPVVDIHTPVGLSAASRRRRTA